MPAFREADDEANGGSGSIPAHRCIIPADFDRVKFLWHQAGDFSGLDGDTIVFHLTAANLTTGPGLNPNASETRIGLSELRYAWHGKRPVIGIRIAGDD